MEVKKKKSGVPTVTTKALKSLREKLAKMDWCDIAHNLMILDAEYTSVKKHLNPKEILSYRKLIAAYEFEKVARIKAAEDNNPSSFYGPIDATAYWIEDESFLK
jgi:hypothetical protein